MDRGGWDDRTGRRERLEVSDRANKSGERRREGLKSLYEGTSKIKLRKEKLGNRSYGGKNDKQRRMVRMKKKI